LPVDFLVFLFNWLIVGILSVSEASSNKMHNPASIHSLIVMFHSGLAAGESVGAIKKLSRNSPRN
jgi:hypothetical protein